MTRTTVLRLVLAVLVVASILTAPALAEEPVEPTAEEAPLNLETVELGDPALEEARQLILDERWRKARRALTELRQTPQKHDEAGLTLALQALVEQETGDADYARCLWVQGRYLHPPLANTEFGTLPVYQGVVQPRDPDELVSEPAAEGGEEREILPPSKIGRSDVTIPPSWRHRDDLWGRVVVQAVISEEGTVDDIVVLDTSSTASALLTLASVCRWTFEPATLDGEPVPVYHNLTMNLRRGSREELSSGGDH